MFSRGRKGSGTQRTTFCDGPGTVTTPERRAHLVVDEARTWALSHR